MRVIAVCQQKGGDGKTTVSRLVAEYANKLGLRVLLIDMDQQCNLSQHYLAMDADSEGYLPPVHPDFNPETDINWSGRCSIADVYREGTLRVYETQYKNIMIIPGNSSQIRDLDESPRERHIVILDRLRDALELEFSNDFDLVVIDTPPSQGPLVRSALRASTHMLVPVQLEVDSMRGLQGMNGLLGRENSTRKEGSELKLIGILPNKVKGVGLHTGIKDYLFGAVGFKEQMMPCEIGDRIIFAESAHPMAKPRSVFDKPEKNKARQDAERACKIIFERMGFHEELKAQRRA